MLVKGQEEANLDGFGEVVLTRAAVLAQRKRR